MQPFLPRAVKKVFEPRRHLKPLKAELPRRRPFLNRYYVPVDAVWHARCPFHKLSLTRDRYVKRLPDDRVMAKMLLSRRDLFRYLRTTSSTAFLCAPTTNGKCGAATTTTNTRRTTTATCAPTCAR